MMVEQIEKTAMEYAVENSWYPGETSYESDIKEMEESFADAFKAGSQWRINSVWHDARKDVPEEFIPILVERDDFTFSVNMVGGNMASCPLHWVRWAYVIDLLPERKEGGEK